MINTIHYRYINKNLDLSYVATSEDFDYILSRMLVDIDETLNSYLYNDIKVSKFDFNYLRCLEVNYNSVGSIVSNIFMFNLDKLCFIDKHGAEYTYSGTCIYLSRIGIKVKKLLDRFKMKKQMALIESATPWYVDKQKEIENPQCISHESDKFCDEIKKQDISHNMIKTTGQRPRVIKLQEQQQNIETLNINQLHEPQQNIETLDINQLHEEMMKLKLIKQSEQDALDLLKKKTDISHNDEVISDTQDIDQIYEEMMKLRSIKETEQNSLDKLKDKAEKQADELYDNRAALTKQQLKDIEKKSQFYANKRAYYIIKEELSSGKISVVPKMFDTFDIYKYLDVNNILESDDEYEMYTKIHKTNPTNESKTYVPHNINYLPDVDKTKYVQDSNTDIFGEPIEEVTHSNGKKKYPSIEEILSSVDNDNNIDFSDVNFEQCVS